MTSDHRAIKFNGTISTRKKITLFRMILKYLKIGIVRTVYVPQFCKKNKT